MADDTSTDGGAGPTLEPRSGFEREALPELDSLHARALRLTGGDRMRAEDLVQETMLRALRAWDGYENGTNAGAWLMTILRNTFVGDYRRRKREPVALPVDERSEASVFFDVAHADPEGTFFDHLVDREVVEAIEALPEPFRVPLVMADLEELSYGEIGELLDLPVGTVKSRLHRARRRLQHRLYDYAVEMGYVSGSSGARSARAGWR
ncbi:MAG TPA: sigma-70 family RNA polymerase sigma factor [Gemmatimonadota bacterium]|nr:sigma-70 family RNA polymerase sigma factor [Gemmatimonadota bacterium]